MMQVNDVQEDGLQNADYINSDPEESGENSGRNSALSVPLAAFQFVRRLATGMFSRAQKNLGPISLVENELELKISEGKDSSDESSSQKSKFTDSCGRETEEEVAPEAQELLEAAEALCNLRTEESNAPACSGGDTCSFKHFDIAKDPLDHYFLGAYGQVNAFFFSFLSLSLSWDSSLISQIRYNVVSVRSIGIVVKLPYFSRILHAYSSRLQMYMDIFLDK
jgi:ubiquitin-conjugating enzyme E2 O